MQDWRIAEDWPMATLQRIDTSLQLVTIKASLIIPADAVLLDSILSQVPNGPAPNRSIYLMQIGSAFLFFSSLIFSIVAILAFLRKDHGGKNTYQSLIFFGSIANLKVEDYVKRAEKARPEELTADILRQIHLLSSVLLKKFRLLNWSLHSLAAGAILMLTSILFSAN